MIQDSLAEVLANAIATNATSLDISKRGLVEFPQEVASLTNLRSLDIGGNRLTSLPPAIGELVNLEDLYARENYISSIPAEIGNMRSLRNLWLGGNKLHILPSTIGELENLEELYIYENHLESLPRSITSLPSLSELDVSRNFLRVLPPTLASLKRLMVLKVWGNPLEEVAEEILHLPLLTEKSLRELASVLPRRQAQKVYASCFISYSVLDTEFVEQLFRDLRSSGVQCWYAPENLTIGARTRATLHDAIYKHDRVLLVVSSHAVKSSWVEDEVERALQIEREKLRPILFPIRIDNEILATEAGWCTSVVNSRNVGDFTSWRDPVKYEASLSRLLRDLELVASR